MSLMIGAEHIAPTLQAALETWEQCESRLTALYTELSNREVDGAEPYDPGVLAAPLPRSWQWLDGSAFPSHGELMQKAFKLPPIETTNPLMYQGMSHQFLSGLEDVPFQNESDGIDFEGEFAVITGPVPLGTTESEAIRHIRLAVQINDWSLRVIAPVEMKTGFGWIQAKPACSVAPLAVTLDELGDAWSDCRPRANLEVAVNGVVFGDVPATEMQFGFHDLIRHAARTRQLCAGTIIGSGTVSSSRWREFGSCCIAEKRAIEMIETGAPTTPFLRFGDRIRMRTKIPGQPFSVFGEIDQRVTSS
jgi:fumarylacetoacetate (FAA) hydrolase